MLLQERSIPKENHYYEHHDCAQKRKFATGEVYCDLSASIWMMLQLFRKTQHQYNPVDGKSLNGGSRIRTHYSRHIVLITAAFPLASAITGFDVGRLSMHSPLTL